MGWSVVAVAWISLIGLLAAGCRSTIDQVDVPVVEQIIRTRDQVEISRAELLAALGSAQVIYLGERHDAVRHHALQLEVLQALIEAERRPAIGFETFPLQHTSALMEFTRVGDAGDESEVRAAVQQLRDRVDWDASQDDSWSWYGPLLQLARVHELPVFGADLPWVLRTRIGKWGLDGLSPVEASLLHPSGFSDPAYEALMHRHIKGAHCGWGSPDYLSRMYETWVARNDAMSMAIAETLRDRPDEPVVVILGAGHTLYDMGVYERVAYRVPGVRQINIGFRNAASEPWPNSRGLRMLEVDDSQFEPDHQYIWLTRRIGDPPEDPCAAFLESRPPAPDTPDAPESTDESDTSESSESSETEGAPRP